MRRVCVCGEIHTVINGVTQCPIAIERERERIRRRPSAGARGLGGTHPRLAREQVERVPYCEICGSTTDLTGGHIVARVHGGQNVAENYRTECRVCNARHGATLRRGSDRRPGA